MAEIISAGVRIGGQRPWKRAVPYGIGALAKRNVLGCFRGCWVLPGSNLAVCILTAIVGFNYLIVCAHFPDGGGVYSEHGTEPLSGVGWCASAHCKFYRHRGIGAAGWASVILVFR